MDENKLKKLKSLGYEIKACCDLCMHGDFHPKQDFGVCLTHKYKHQKHTGDARCMSIHRNGVCNKGYKADEYKMSALGTYGQFL